MATRSTNPHRLDPYKNFKFRVKFEGRPVAGVARVTGLTARKLPGLQKYPNLTFKRGMTRDTDFQKWATSKSHSRRDLVIEVYDEAGKLDKAFKVHRGYVCKFEAPDLNARASDIGVESLTLEHEGVELMAPGRPRPAGARPT